MPAKSVMFCAPFTSRPSTPLKLARSPSDTVTSYVLLSTAATCVTVAVVVPLTEKSPASTFWTSSSNVTRHTNVSAFVGLLAGFCRWKAVSVGAVLSTTYDSSVPGSPAGSTLPAASVMSWPDARLSLTVPFRPARSPPETVMSYWLSLLPLTADTPVIVAVVPLVAKSATPTLITASLNVARNTSVSALVGLLAGFCRWKAVRVGAVLSTTYVSSVAGSPDGSALPAKSVTSSPAARFSPTVAFRPAKSPPETVTSYRLFPLPATGDTSLIPAIVSLTVKSAVSTPVTASSKVARNTSVSAFVGLVGGVWRVKDVKPGAVVSYVKVAMEPPSTLPAMSSDRARTV